MTIVRPGAGQGAGGTAMLLLIRTTNVTVDGNPVTLRGNPAVVAE